MQNHATLETELQDVRTRVTIVEAHFCGDMHYRNVAMCFTRASNSASNSSAAADECEPGWQVCSISDESRRASSAIAGSVAGSSDLKSGGTLELLIRCESGSRHLAEYGSPKKSSNERRVNSGFSSKAV